MQKLLAVLLGLVCIQVHAQVAIMPPYNQGNLGSLDFDQYLRSVYSKASGSSSNAQKSPSRMRPAASLQASNSAVGIARSASPTMPAKIAATYPGSAQQDAERLFREMLDKHPQLMKQLGVPPDDLASAIATFVAGSYIAYRDIDFPDQNFKPLYQQVRGIIASNPDLLQASAAEKREMFEQMAILGTFMALTRDALKKQPNAQTTANMRTAAKSYLEGFLKTDADRVQITANGLVLK